MFGLGGGELLLVILLGVLLIGPRDLAKAMTQMGRWYRHVKAAAEDLRDTVEREVHQPEGLEASPPPEKKSEPPA